MSGSSGSQPRSGTVDDRTRGRGRARWLAVAAAAAPVTAFALPDETPWGRADGEACHDCHFGHPVEEPSGALELDGLPERFVTGETYRLVLELDTPEMRRAGFRVIAHASGGPPGRFEAVDAATETDGDRVRSTLAGSALDEPGRARWTFHWHAPETAPAGAIELEISANAADDDASPLGDVIHRRRIVTKTPASEAAAAPE